MIPSTPNDDPLVEPSLAPEGAFVAGVGFAWVGFAGVGFAGVGFTWVGFAGVGVAWVGFAWVGVGTGVETRSVGIGFGRGTLIDGGNSVEGSSPKRSGHCGSEDCNPVGVSVGRADRYIHRVVPFGGNDTSVEDARGEV